MSNLDILEVALYNIRDKLELFYNLIADVDNRLVNAENYLLDNGDSLNPIFSILMKVVYLQFIQKHHEQLEQNQ